MGTATLKQAFQHVARFLCIGLAIVGTPELLYAQEASANGNYAVDLQTFHFSPSATGFFSTESAEVMEHTRFNFGLVGNYANQPFAIGIKDLAGEQVTRNVIGYRADAEVFAAFSFFNRLEMGVVMPMISQSGFDTRLTQDVPGFTPGPVLKSFGLGDLRVIPKLRLFTVGDRAFSVALLAPLAFQTHSQDYGGFDNPQYTGALVISSQMSKRFRFALNGGYIKRKAVNTPFLRIADEVFAKFALAGNVAPASRVPIEIITEVLMRTPPEDMFGLRRNPNRDRARTPIEADIGLRIHFNEHADMSLGAGVMMTSSYFSPLPRAFIAFTFHNTMLSADADNDKIPDKSDACIDKPEDIDTFEDADGCPDEDNDKDGILDAQDSCPLNSEDRDGFKDDDGCPDDDNDEDGLFDTEDVCPNAAGDKTVAGPRRGCPNNDKDNDGISDAKDKCPTEAELYNSVGDEDGCPDPEYGQPRVRINGYKIALLAPIQFKPNSDSIKPKSHRVLNEVASLLRHADAIEKVRIDAHTDSKGKPQKKLLLSQRQAEAVMRFLIVRGVAADRLVARGLGGTEPLESNATKKGRKANQRVEFVIIGGSQAAAETTGASPLTPAMPVDPTTPPPTPAPLKPPPTLSVPAVSPSQAKP